jgi:hypothetical protein
MRPKTTSLDTASLKVWSELPKLLDRIPMSNSYKNSPALCENLPCLGGTGGTASKPSRLTTRSGRTSRNSSSSPSIHNTLPKQSALIVQKSGDKVYNYFVSNIYTFCHFMDSKPENDILRPTPMIMAPRETSKLVRKNQGNISRFSSLLPDFETTSDMRS